jgi:hypothetical protein
MEGTPAAVAPGEPADDEDHWTGPFTLRQAAPSARNQERRRRHLVAADLPFLPDTPAQLATLGAAALIYCMLIAVVALAAVFSSKPSRRKAALEVLWLLLPRRHQPPPNNPGQASRPQPKTPSRRRQRRLPSPDP